MKKIIIVLISISALFFISCQQQESSSRTTSSSGVKRAEIKVKTDPKGHTVEQNNIVGRYEEDNKPGSIKHLYVISAYSGQVIIYSTVRGKVTSSNKRLTPNTVAAMDGDRVMSSLNGMAVNISGETYRTPEVLQDDGTYGHSMEYLYWWDVKGIYHQHYVTGGQILHISSEPLAVKNVVINMEVNKNTEMVTPIP